MSPEIELLRQRVRNYVNDTVISMEKADLWQHPLRLDEVRSTFQANANEAGIHLPHLP